MAKCFRALIGLTGDLGLTPIPHMVAHNQSSVTTVPGMNILVFIDTYIRAGETLIHIK